MLKVVNFDKGSIYSGTPRIGAGAYRGSRMKNCDSSIKINPAYRGTSNRVCCLNEHILVPENLGFY